MQSVFSVINNQHKNSVLHIYIYTNKTGDCLSVCLFVCLSININARNKPVSVAETVDGKSGTHDISAMWKDHFQKLLHSVPSSSMNLSLHDYYFECFTPTEIADAISSLKNGKSSGVDQLFAEHVKNADKRVTVLLSLLFNACVIHGFLPVGLVETVIVPIIKNARENISSKDNYWPIALTNTLSKIIEKLIFGSMQLIVTNHRESIWI